MLRVTSSRADLHIYFKIKNKEGGREWCIERQANFFSFLHHNCFLLTHHWASCRLVHTCPPPFCTGRSPGPPRRTGSPGRRRGRRHTANTRCSSDTCPGRSPRGTGDTGTRSARTWTHARQDRPRRRSHAPREAPPAPQEAAAL